MILMIAWLCIVLVVLGNQVSKRLDRIANALERGPLPSKNGVEK